MNGKKDTRLSPLLFNNVRITGGFWEPRINTNRNVTLPIAYKHLKTTGRLAAWQLKWKKGDPNPPHVFWDSDVAKWMEAASHSLVQHPDQSLERKLDRVISLMKKAQRRNGYLNTHFISVEPEKRWTNLRDAHELYCAGHLMEAAVAHYHATGKRSFLDIMCRYADHICKVFGPHRGQKRGYPGHQEIELALVKLSAATGEQRYLDMAEFFINERGTSPNYFEKEARARGEKNRKTCLNGQAHIPVREQTKVVGHAVRAMYMYAGMADVAAATGDKSLLKACRILWRNLTDARMHVTGGIGPIADNEGFTEDYDLPTETAYLETCAAIGLVFWAHRMLHADLNSEYSDVMELALYNGVLSGVAIEGDTFFYANPLAVHPGHRGSHYVGSEFHYRRSPWFGTACCPTNVVRLLASMGSYIYSTGHREVCVHLYINSKADIITAGKKVHVEQSTTYPWRERVRLAINPEEPVNMTVSLRIPGWCHGATVKVNGDVMPLDNITRKGYARIKRRWEPGDIIELHLPMPIERIRACPEARQTCGRVALKRGPVVYCLEEVDNGPNLNDISLPPKAKLTSHMATKLLGGAIVVNGTAMRRKTPAGKELYTNQPPRFEKTRITAIPYHLWAHRKPGEMIVWIRE